MFAFGGIEVIGITASEAQNPEKRFRKRSTAKPLRILLFYVLTPVYPDVSSPWNQIGHNGSPFADFRETGISLYAANILEPGGDHRSRFCH